MEPINTNDISRLISRYLQGTLTTEEQIRLNTWRDSKPERAQLLHQLVEESFLAANLHVLNSVDSEVAFEAFKPRIKYAEPKMKILTVRKWLPYAAALLIACTAGFLIWQYTQQAAYTFIAATNVSPGGNRAFLTLEDGRSITLDGAHKGIVVSEEVRYSDGSELLPQVSGQLTMTTPNGGTYQLTLPDGTRVWLNAASTISYPSRFTDSARVVNLTGEAYFSVTKDVYRPFKVLSSGQEIEVLGTEFNLAAYADEPHMITTLVSGEVKVVAADVGPTILRPGEQSTLSAGKFTKAQVDTDPFTAWKDGWLSFHNKPFDQIMREVERWYDIDIRYEGPVPQEIGYGMVPRTDNLSVVLRLLEAGDIRFRLAGRTLIIINERKEVDS